MKHCCIYLFIFLVGCKQASETSSEEIPQAVWLANEADTMGVDFTWISGDAGKFNMPEIIGGGGALFDYDNDGDLDLYMVQGGYLDSPQEVMNQLFRNENGHFKNVTEESNSGDTGYGMGVAAGDYNNDGHVDLYITNVGKNTLLQNNGDGTFKDTTLFAGVGDIGWGASTAFADFDQDGDFDLYVVNYLIWEHGLKIDCYNAKGAIDYCSPTNYMAPQRDVVYKNNGDGTFTDMTTNAGLGARIGTGLGVLCNDYTGDGLIDIFVANDGMADQLWENQGDWTFIDVAPLRGCALDDEGNAKAGMGVASEDFDHDGDLDIIVCNLTGESDSLFRNDGDFFTDITSSKGIRTSTRHATRFGLGMIDFNNDGYLDLFEANGKVQQSGESNTKDPFAEPNLLLEGGENGWIPIAGLSPNSSHTSRGAIFGDINNDGGIDVVVINKDSNAYILMNKVPARGDAALFEVLTPQGSPALGALLKITTNGKTITKPVQSASSYLAANDPRVHVPIEDGNILENVTVFWTDGTSTNFGSFSSGIHSLKKK